MLWARLKFDIIQNIHLYYLEYNIDIFFLIFFILLLNFLIYIFCKGFLDQLVHFFVAVKFLFVVISPMTCYLKDEFIVLFIFYYKMKYIDTIMRFFLLSITNFILSFLYLFKFLIFKQLSNIGNTFLA